MTYYYLDVEDLNRMLEHAICRCIYRINGLCDPECLAQAYCEPEVHGLTFATQLNQNVPATSNTA